MATAKSPRRPLRGLRLTYEINLPLSPAGQSGPGALLAQAQELAGDLVPGNDDNKVLVRMKESIGNFLGLRPVPPRTAAIANGPYSGRSRLLQPAGFRFESYQFLVLPGTKIKEPAANCYENKTEERLICSFSIGFGRGPKERRINRWRIQQWIMTTRASNRIMGFVTPSGVKHIWRGQLDAPQRVGILPNPFGGLPFPDIGNLPDTIEQGLDIAQSLGILPSLPGF